MFLYSRNFVVFAVLLGTGTSLGSSVAAQDGPADAPNSEAEQSRIAAIREILESDRWRRMNRSLNEWLSVQTLYTDDQVAAMLDDIRRRVRTMSPREAEDFMEEMEDRLAVLLSPEAEDARQWLSEFLAVAANPEITLGRPLPDVANMTASQIRQEIQWLQQHRAARQQAHTTGIRTRQAQAARQPNRSLAPDRSSWPANNTTRRSQYAPQAELRPQPLTVTPYIVSPWGTPIIFNPLSDRW